VVLDVHTELGEMDYVIEKFPQAPIVFPHVGNGKAFGHIFKRIEAVAKHPNTYLDKFGVLPRSCRDARICREDLGPDRVLVRIRFLIDDSATVIARIEHAAIGEEQRLKILPGNLEALLEKFGRARNNQGRVSGAAWAGD
jgi:predicted TIM-barrel fold metal-dependent hydrolase